jgi:cysteine desulfurase / selenocysteine lyase
MIVSEGQSQSVRRLYIDNAATSFPKPPAVMEAMTRYAQDLGASAGRGGYVEAVETGKIIADCRAKLRKLFNGAKNENFIFTLNCSHALNMAIKGLLTSLKSSSFTPHAICTGIDHNSILRPMGALEDLQIASVTHVPVDPGTGLLDPEDLRKAIRKETRAIAVTHASNVTGTLQDLLPIGKIAGEYGIPLIVDAAQSAGHLPIDVVAMNIDLLAAPGHKGLLGPLGTGFLYIRPGLEKRIRPLMEGGTGSVSEHDRQPEMMPDKFESGSHNAIGIAGLRAGVQWVLDRGVEKIWEHERALIKTFLEGMDNIPHLKLYGPNSAMNRVGVFSVRIGEYSPHELAGILETHYGILTRAGLHCAPHIHQAQGSLPLGGTTRFSFGPFLNLPDITFAADALAEIAMETPAAV